MATLYHGTTLENWERIQSEGWNGPSRKTAWYCSCNEIYCYDLSKSDCDFDPSAFCIRQAFESAQTAAAIQNYLGQSLVVIEFEIDDDLVEDDLSCENMADIASVIQPEDIQPHHVTNVYRCDNYRPSLRLVYVAGLLTYSEYLDKSNFDDVELNAASKLTEVYCDELHEFDWHLTT